MPVDCTESESEEEGAEEEENEEDEPPAKRTRRGSKSAAAAPSRKGNKGEKKAATSPRKSPGQKRKKAEPKARKKNDALKKDKPRRAGMLIPIENIEPLDKDPTFETRLACSTVFDSLVCLLSLQGFQNGLKQVSANERVGGCDKLSLFVVS